LVYGSHTMVVSRLQLMILEFDYLLAIAIKTEFALQ
jgi:hypothetical protein